MRDHLPGHNLISQTLLYALSVRNISRRSLALAINERVQTYVAGAPAFTEITLSRIVNDKRGVRDYELLAMTEVLGVDFEWLIGRRQDDLLGRSGTEQ